MKRRPIIVICGLAFLAIVGIGLFLVFRDKNPLVGEWMKVEEVPGTKEYLKSGFVFKKNGEYESYRVKFDGNKEYKVITTGKWSIDESGALITDIHSTTLNGKSDYAGEYSKNLLNREESYNKKRVKDAKAKERSAAACYYLEEDTLYIDGNAYTKESKTNKAEKTLDCVPFENGQYITFNSFILYMDPEGVYRVYDPMDRKVFSLCEKGTYACYGNKLILSADNNRMELQLYKDGERWICDMEDSYGVMDKIWDLSPWEVMDGDEYADRFQ